MHHPVGHKCDSSGPRFSSHKELTQRELCSVNYEKTVCTRIDNINYALNVKFIDQRRYVRLRSTVSKCNRFYHRQRVCLQDHLISASPTVYAPFGTKNNIIDKGTSR
jgi:hypothetical protein